MTGVPALAVLDTNAIVSAFLSPGGPPARIVASIGRRAFIPLYDSRVIAEYRAVLRRPRFGLDPADVERFVRMYMARGWAVEAADWRMPLADEADRPFVEVAAGMAGLVVTGNARHFPAAPWVVSPAEFWARLSGG